MKHTLTLMMASLLIQPMAYANPMDQQNELSEAQMRYQILLKNQANDRSDFARLQNRLQAAEKKLASAQLEVDKIRAELLLRQELQNANNDRLKEAGNQVNKAWNAVYGAEKSHAVPAATMKETAKITNKVQSAQSAAMKETAKITDKVQSASSATMKETAKITDKVQSASSAAMKETAKITDKVQSASSTMKETAKITDKVQSASSTAMKETAKITDKVQSASSAAMKETAKITDKVQSASSTTMQDAANKVAEKVAEKAKHVTTKQ